MSLVYDLEANAVLFVGISLHCQQALVQDGIAVFGFMDGGHNAPPIRSRGLAAAAAASFHWRSFLRMTASFFFCL